MDWFVYLMLLFYLFGREIEDNVFYECCLVLIEFFKVKFINMWKENIVGRIGLYFW